MGITILGIESSCDDTSAAVIRDEYLLSNVIAGQAVHEKYGGVVPELASRAHQQNIVPVIDVALKDAGITVKDIDAIAFTRGPGLLGSLLVGTSFAKGLALSLGIPMVEVNHLQGHVLAHFIKEKKSENRQPEFPFLSLLVSGGNTQLIIVKNYFDMEIIGQSIDDAAGEAFDKSAKVMGLHYPGGPIIDKAAKLGNSNAFKFSKPSVGELDFSFSGLKTAFLYLIRDEIKKNPNFIEERKNDLCASLQHTIVDILANNLIKAQKKYGINTITLGGGVSANSGLRDRMTEEANKRNWNLFLPPFKLTTDNAAMIAITGYHKYLKKEYSSLDVTPKARFAF